MALYEFECRGCRYECERLLYSFEETSEQFCDECDEQLKLKPSVPGYFRPGKFGKGRA